MEIDQELLDWAHRNEVCVKWGTHLEGNQMVGVYRAHSGRMWEHNAQNWATGATMAEAIRALREKIGGVK